MDNERIKFHKRRSNGKLLSPCVIRNAIIHIDASILGILREKNRKKESKL